MVLEDVVKFLILGPACSTMFASTCLSFSALSLRVVNSGLLKAFIFSLFVKTTMLLGESRTGVTSSACMRCVR